MVQDVLMVSARACNDIFQLVCLFVSGGAVPCKAWSAGVVARTCKQSGMAEGGLCGGLYENVCS